MHFCSYKSILILLVLNKNLINCAGILAIFPSPGYSQYILAEPLILSLAERGHRVTVISAFETKNVQNVKNIVVDLSMGEENPERLFELQDLSIFENTIFLNEFGLSATEKLLADKKVQELLKSKKEKFDLVLIETFFNEAHHAFASHFNAHKILFHSMAVNEWGSHLVGNPNIPSYIPNSFGGYTTNMSFQERFRNTVALWFGRIYNYFIQYPANQKLVDRYFPGNHNLNEILYNSSLMLTCSHVSTTEAVPITTSVVEVGGLHVVNKKLPDNVKECLDSAKEGAIFFSLGSNIQSSSMPRETIQGILAAFGKLKQKVLWKFENNNIENIPDNVMISKWFPQSDILAHSNTILFISHCGMGSTTEAIYHGVPVIGIPIYGDQFMNARRLAQFGMGVELPLKELSGTTIGKFVSEILNDSKYRDMAKKRSRIMHDRPMKPLDSAVYWIEYVLRHGGAHHLKNSLLKLTWYQLYLLDIIAVLFVIFFIVFYIILVLIRYIKRRVSGVDKRKVE